MSTFPRVFAIPTLLLLVGGACTQNEPLAENLATLPGPDSLPIIPTEAALKVLVIGDHGTGGPGQRAVAQKIAEVHGELPPDLVLTVGDNFYPGGVYSRGDSEWQSAFERVYTGPFWEALTFYPSLGNHDHLGYPSAQVSYSSVSSRWYMPGLYYTFEREIPAGDTIPGDDRVLFVALDTEGLRGSSSNARQQVEWADSVLSETEARWIVVYGHHPMVTGAGPHPGSDDVRQVILSHLEERAGIYVTGHNHTIELMVAGETVPQPTCGGGAGLDNAHRLNESDAGVIAFTGGGWCFLSIWPGTLALDLYDRDGNLRHRTAVAWEDLIPGTADGIGNGDGGGGG